MGHESNNAPSTVDNFTTETNHGNRGAGRRTACILCRDRKVRCDGARPTCDRCLAANETCVYANPARRSKADMLETINDLRDQLGTQAPHRLSFLLAPCLAWCDEDDHVLTDSCARRAIPSPTRSSNGTHAAHVSCGHLYPPQILSRILVATDSFHFLAAIFRSHGRDFFAIPRRNVWIADR